MLHNLKNKFSIKKETEFEKFFYPKSIAVIGASNNTEKIGGYIFSQIKKNKEIEIFPINTKSDKIQDIKSYINIRAIEKKVDLVIIVIPSIFVNDAIKDCIIANSKNIIVISAGFKEIGEEGKKREEELKKLIKENSLNLIGPNCLGIINAENKLNCSFAKDIPKFGGTALISQSGAVIDGIIDWSFKNNIKFSKIVSLGNMAGLSELEILKYLGDDKKTTSIVYYIETLENGVEFAKVLKEISKKKPVIIIKPGKSKNAQKAIGSHTGSLAQDNILVEILLKENNAIFVNSLNELFNMLIALKSNLPKNNNLVILTNAGGPGVIATDILDKTNFKLYEFSNEEKEKFYNFLPKEASINNPVDILGDARSNRYKDALNLLVQNPNIGNILVLLTPQIMTDSEFIAKNLIEIKKKTDKNIFSCFIGDKEIKNSLKLFNENNFSNFATPIDALISLNYLLNYKNFNYLENDYKYNFDKNKIKEINEKLFLKKGLLDYFLTKEILKVLEIELPYKIIVENLNNLDEINLYENKKYVIKADSKDLIHKKDLGGVILNVDSKNYKKNIISLFHKLEKITKDFKITIEEEVTGTEIILGLKSDLSLGNFIMFGMGGTYVSVINDINFSTCPLNFNSSKKLVKKSKVFKILKGFRGGNPINFENLYELLIRMSYLQQIFPQIKEVDLNPVICNENNIYLVDVKLIL